MSINYRDESIDVMRGIAMICVMLGHLGNVPETVMQWVYPFYIPVFFFITGYLKEDKEYSKRDVIKRFRRLILPYLGYNMMLVVGAVLIHHINIHDVLFAFGGILYSRFCLFPRVEAVDNVFFFTVANSPLWFLTASFVAEVLYILLSKVTKIEQRGWLCFLLIGIGYAATYLEILLPWSLDTAMIGTVFMFVGNCYKRISLKKNSYVWLLLLYILVVYINPGANMSVRYYGPWNISILLFIVGGICGSILLKLVSEFFAECKAIGGIKRVFCVVGENSLSILAFHWFLFLFFDIAINKLHITILWKAGYGIFKICVAIILCICFGNITSLLHRKKV